MTTEWGHRCEAHHYMGRRACPMCEDEQRIADLERENAELRRKLERRTSEIKSAAVELVCGARDDVPRPGSLYDRLNKLIADIRRLDGEGKYEMLAALTGKEREDGER